MRVGRGSIIASRGKASVVCYLGWACRCCECGGSGRGREGSEHAPSRGAVESSRKRGYDKDEARTGVED
jgi:hypothetical protein